MDESLALDFSQEKQLGYLERRITCRICNNLTVSVVSISTTINMRIEEEEEAKIGFLLSSLGGSENKNDSSFQLLHATHAKCQTYTLEKYSFGSRTTMATNYDLCYTLPSISQFVHLRHQTFLTTKTTITDF